MYNLSNDVNSINKRRHSNRLLMAGRTLILLNVWAIVKNLIMAYSGVTSENVALPEYGNTGDEFTDTVIYIAYLFIFALFLVMVLLNVYIGRSAIKDAHDKKRSVVYLIWTVFFIIVTVMSDIRAGFQIGEEDFYLWISSIVIDITMLLTYIVIMYSAIMKRVSKKRINSTVEKVEA